MISRIDRKTAVVLALAYWLTLLGLSPFECFGQETSLHWHDAADFALEGRGWPQAGHPYRRLPAKAEALVRRPVWELALHSAGLSVRFVTDATTIAVRWSLGGKRLEMPHMPATGVSGLDLYVQHAGRWNYLATARPAAVQPTETVLIRGLAKGQREFRLYLPLYNSVDRLEIGVPSGAVVRSGVDTSRIKPLVFYGTSITQGGCAARPGMAYPSIVGRMLDIPVINLGFSGNGKTEPELARLLAELDPAAYVLDSLANLETAQVSERLPAFVDMLREQHPKTPIILLESIPYPDRQFVPKRNERFSGSNNQLKRIYDDRWERGDRRIYYVPCQDSLGTDGEGTVDGVHPTDLGFQRMAESLVPHLRQIPGFTRSQAEQANQ